MLGSEVQVDWKQLLIESASQRYALNDVAHDILHGKQVAKNIIRIAKYEGGNHKVLFPAALLHDIISYRKSDPHSVHAADESAALASMLLEQLPEFPHAFIPQVALAIREHSYSRGLRPSTLESALLQDADRLEAIGAIGIMRSSAIAGSVQKMLYCEEDPFCDLRKPVGRGAQLDMYFSRFLKLAKDMHTSYAQQLAEQRVQFMYQFLEQLRSELA